MRINRIPGVKFTSNVYHISYEPIYRRTYLIDAGCLSAFQKDNSWPNDIFGIFLTHAHYDHVYDLSVLLKKYPKLIVYLSSETYNYLKDPKLNLSRYHECDVEIELFNYRILDDGDEVELYPGVNIQALRTPGHSDDCLSFKIFDNFFTGDSLIPEVSVVTKLRFGSKEKALQSLNRLKGIMSKNSVIWPGHLEPKVLSDINWKSLI